MTNPGTVAGILPRTEDWIARELAGLKRQMRHRPSLWQQTYSFTGTLLVTAGTSRIYNREGYPLSIITVHAQVNTAPTGADLILDLLKNGTTIYTSATPPTIAIDAFDVAADLPDDLALLAGDYLTVDVTQVGSTVAGADLTVQVRAA